MLHNEPLFAQYWVTAPEEVTRDEAMKNALPPTVNQLISEVKDAIDLRYFLHQKEMREGLEQEASILTTKYIEKLEPLWKADDVEIIKIKEELKSLLKKFEYDGNDTTTNEKYLAAYREGLPLLFDIFHIIDTQSIPVDLLKTTMLSLFDGMNLCFPGVHTRAAYAWMQLCAPTPQHHLMNMRQEMAKKEALLRIRKLSLMKEEGMAGNEIHFLNSILNYCAFIFGLMKIDDSFALDLSSVNIYPTSWNAYQWHNELKKIAQEMAPLLTPQVVFEMLAENITDEILTFKNDAEQSDKIINLLDRYGPDDDFQLAYNAMTVTGKLQPKSELHQNIRISLLRRSNALKYADMGSEKQLSLTPTVTLHQLPDPSFHYVTESSFFGSSPKTLPLVNYFLQSASGYSVSLEKYDDEASLKTDIQKHLVPLPAFIKIGETVYFYGKNHGRPGLVKSKWASNFLDEKVWNDDSINLSNECYQAIAEQKAYDEPQPLELLQKLNTLLFPNTVLSFLSLFTTDALTQLSKSGWSNLTKFVIEHAEFDINKKIEFFFGKNTQKESMTYKPYFEMAIACGQDDAVRQLLVFAKAALTGEQCKVECLGLRCMDTHDVGTYLHLAVFYGHLNIVDQLLLLLDSDELLSFIDISNRKDETALFIAGKKGYIDIMDRLLIYYEPSHRLRILMIELEVAVEKGEISAIENLLTAVSVEDQLFCRKMLLWFAARDGRLEVIQRLLSGLNYTDRFAYLIQESVDQQTPLFIAARKGHFKVVEELLKGLTPEDSLKYITMVTRYGDTPLYIACYYGNVEVVYRLLACLADSHRLTYQTQTTLSGLTPFFVAAKNEREAVIKILLSNVPSTERLAYLKKTYTEENRTALYIAVKNRHIGVIKELLADLTPAERLEYILQSGDDGETVLYVAAMDASLDVLTCLLTSLDVADRLKALSKASAEGATPLMIASHRGHVSVVKTLLKNLSHVDRLLCIKQASIKYGVTALIVAVSENHFDVIEALLAGQTSKERFECLMQTKSHGETALYVAAIRDYLFIVRQLLKNLTALQHLDFLMQGDSKGNTPLSAAAQSGALNSVIQLLTTLTPLVRFEYIKQANIDGETPLFLAASHDHLVIVKQLLKNLTVDERFEYITQANKGGMTPLYSASYYGNDKTVEELLKNITPEMRSAYLKQKNKGGRTALFSAAENGHWNVVDILLKNMKPSERLDCIIQTDNNILSVINVAAMNGHTLVIERLLANLAPHERLPCIMPSNLDSLTPLFYAAQEGYLNVINILIANTFSSELLIFPLSSTSEELLNFAETRNVLPEMNEFLRENSPDQEGNVILTPMDIAKVMGHQEIVVYLQKQKELANNFVYQYAQKINEKIAFASSKKWADLVTLLENHKNNMINSEMKIEQSLVEHKTEIEVFKSKLKNTPNQSIYVSRNVFYGSCDFETSEKKQFISDIEKTIENFGMRRHSGFTVVNENHRRSICRCM